MTVEERLREAWRQTGRGLIGPLVLVAGSGILELLHYNTDPAAAQAVLRDAPWWFTLLRSVHLWSSRALLVGGAVHAAWTWHDRRVVGVHRRQYVLGTLLFALLAFAHWTGHVLRFGPAGLRLLAYEAPWAPVGATGLARLQMPLHISVIGGVAFVVALLHLGLAGVGQAPDVRRRFPGGWRRLRPGVALAGGVLTAAVAAGAFLSPAPTSQEGLPWPFPFLARAAGLVHADAGFGVAALVLVGLLALQPWLEGHRFLTAATRWLLAGALVLSFAR